MHPSIVAYERLCARMVGRIDTQQLPSPGSDSRRCGSAVTILAITGHDVYESRLESLLADVREPLCVTVRGRPGVGCRTVSRALRSVGVRVVEPALGERDIGERDVGLRDVGERDVGQVDMYVFTEVLKSEDLAALAELGRPRLVVCNKADLGGLGSGALGSGVLSSGALGSGPVDAVRARCRELGRWVRMPIEPLASVVAIAGSDDSVLDESMWAALEVLINEPADLGSTDRFVERPHSLSCSIRRRLLARLDLYGIACAVSTLRRTGSRRAVLVALREVSGVDGVLDALYRVSAPVRYQRLVDAVRRESGDYRVSDYRASDYWASDEVVLARMDAAAEVLLAAGMSFERAQDARGYLGSALMWDRNARGFLSPLYRACGADIVRGSLRLWLQCEGGRG